MRSLKVAICLFFIVVLNGCEEKNMTPKTKEPEKVNISFEAQEVVDYDRIEMDCKVLIEENITLAEIGICYSQTEEMPDIENASVLKTANPIPEGSFKLNNLPANTNFYIRVFAHIVLQDDAQQSIFYSKTYTVKTLHTLPVFTRVNPVQGYFNDTIHIECTGFEWTPNRGDVYFNGVKAIKITEDNQGCKVLVPRKAGKGPITIKVREYEIKGSIFDFQQDVYDVYTLCGQEKSGFADGDSDKALFNRPRQIVCDENGDLLVSDAFNQRIRKITPEGKVSTLAGTGQIGYQDGPVEQAQFKYPFGLAIHPATNEIYITEADAHCIRKISADGKTITRFKGMPDQSGNMDGWSDKPDISFFRPRGIAFNSKHELFVADQENHRIRKINTLGTTSTFAGYGDPEFISGSGINASIAYPAALYIDNNDNIYTFTLSGGFLGKYSRLVKITPNAMVSLHSDQRFDSIVFGILWDGSDFWIPNISTLWKGENPFSALAGQQYKSVDGPLSKAAFYSVVDITQDKSGKIYVIDQNMIRVIEKMR